MAETRGPSASTQNRSNPNQGEGTAEGVVGQATEAVRNVASSASDLAQDTYERGARYAREGWDSLSDVGRYGGAVSRPIEENPLTAILAAGAAGYLLAYVIHGTGLLSSYDERSHDRRSRGNRRR